MAVFSKHIIVNPRPSGKQGQEFTAKKENNTEKNTGSANKPRKLW
jgi:hypothetical protein